MERKGRLADGFDCWPFHYSACEVEIRLEGKDDGGIIMVLATISCELLQFFGMILYSASMQSTSIIFAESLARFLCLWDPNRVYRVYREARVLIG
jgi:hypothetical protein